MSNLIDIAGQRFGRLVVIERDMSVVGKAMWFCRCDCGSMLVAWGANLRNGNTTSCGCARGRLPRHGDSRRAHRTPEYESWKHLRQRCLNPKDDAYADYGGRGIKVCARWDSFENFLADMGRRPSPDHSIDRRDNDGDYTPTNCRWATRVEQAQNRRPKRPNGQGRAARRAA